MKFKNPSHLKVHKDSIHHDVKFDCSDCGKQFKRKHHLKNHKDNIHEGIKHLCKQCDKQFSYEYD